MRALLQRLSLSPQNRSMRIITFIAARPREGSLTIACDYASMLAAEAAQKVLLIDAAHLGRERFRAYGANAADGQIDANLPDHAIPPAGTNVTIGHWVARPENRSLASRSAADPTFWEAFLASFDTIVIAAPSLQSSFDGVVLAARADAAVLVVEAESTPQAVVENLRDTLASAGARLAGVVMNKRRYYIPQRVYRKL
jgi:Mrp family chromosome partitioning ATPase